MDSHGRSVGEIAELALGTASLAQYRQELVKRLDSEVGLDSALVWTIRQPLRDPVLHGLEPAVFEEFCRRTELYTPQFLPVTERATAQGGVARDTEVYSERVRHEMSLYQDLVLPMEGREFAMGTFGRPGDPLAIFSFGRCGRRDNRFSDAEMQRLRELMPVLSLGELSHAARAPAAEPLISDDVSLSARERELWEYVSLGYTNAEIALACRRSPNTIRNQLAALYRKAGVTNRAELVGLGATRPPR